MTRRRGNAAFGGLKAKLRALPVSLAHNIAQRVAPALASAASSAFDAGRTVYGESRPKGVDGNELDLVASGRTRSTVTYTATGRLVRVALGTAWSKFLIGKYRILPNGAIPVEWKRKIDETVHATKVDLK